MHHADPTLEMPIDYWILESMALSDTIHIPDLIHRVQGQDRVFGTDSQELVIHHARRHAKLFYEYVRPYFKNPLWWENTHDAYELTAFARNLETLAAIEANDCSNARPFNDDEKELRKRIKKGTKAQKRRYYTGIRRLCVI